MNAILTPSNSSNVKQGPWKIDAQRGSRDGRVSSQWFSRPDDQRFLSIAELYNHTLEMAHASDVATANVADLRVVAQADKPDALALRLADGRDVKPTNWSFGQLCSLVKAPAGYLRELPAAIAGINLQYGVTNYRGELMKTYQTKDGSAELRAVTSATYGRIYDHELVGAVKSLCDRDSRWKVPGVINWQDQTYNPNAEVTRESTTLFASDRDVFLFLVDDRHPIEIGKLPDGSPDLVFRGFYAWNSEVGAKSFGLAAFYLRGVCQNRNLWGVEGYKEFTFRHSKGAPARFMREASHRLQQFADGGTQKLIAGVNAAKSAIVAQDDEGAVDYLGKQGFTQAMANKIVAQVLQEEQRPARSIWDMVQGITAVARNNGHQDARIDMERQAGKLLDKIKV